MILDACHPIDATVIAAIRDTLAPFRDELGIGEVRIMPDEDHDGDPVIRVSLQHRLTSPETAFPAMHAADRRVRQVVRDRGEQRFVHVRHLFGDRPEPGTAPSTGR